MSTPYTSAQVAKSIEEIEAVANGEMDFDTEDTVNFFARPRVGARIRTPNGSLIRITRILAPQVSQCELLIMALGTVVDAPTCPHRNGDEVTFLVSQDGSICWYEEQ